MTITETARGSSTQHLVAAGLAALGAVLLAVKAARSFGPDPYDTVEAWAGVAVAAVALAALATAAAAILRRVTTARALSAVTLAASLVVDWLPAAPPRLLHLLPLSLATGLLFVSGSAGIEGHLRSRRGGAVPTEETSASHRPWWASALGWVGIALHAAVGFPYLVSGLVAPLYGVLFLWALWGVLLFVALRVRARRPAWTPVVPIVAVGLWQGIMLLGETVLGWVA